MTNRVPSIALIRALYDVQHSTAAWTPVGEGGCTRAQHLCSTTFGRASIADETKLVLNTEAVNLETSHEMLDVRAPAGGTWAMGDVVDGELGLKRVEGLLMVDLNVISVPFGRDHC